MSKQIQVRILKDGTIEAVTNGIKGAACTSYIPQLEQLLNAKVETSEYTSEFYEENKVSTTEHVEVKTEQQERLERE